MGSLLDRVDHLLYRTPDLETGIAALEARLGVRAALGGRHPGRGTRNALIALTDRSYLEIIAPDPEQPEPASPRWFGLDGPVSAGLVAWCANAGDLDRLVADAAARGVRLGAVASGSRRTTDGGELRWRFTDPRVVIAGGLVPFFIDWGDGPHPASSAPGGLELLSLRGEHPEPGLAEQALAALEIAMPVARGPRARLIAGVRTERGVIELT